MRGLTSLVLAAAAAVLAACANPEAEAYFDGIRQFEALPTAQQQALVNQYAAERTRVSLPLVSSSSELAGLADIFGDACVSGLADRERFGTVAAANGFRAKAGSALQVPLAGYLTSPTPPDPTIEQAITPYAREKLRRADGAIPYFTGKIGLAAASPNDASLSNGRAELAWGRGSSTVCTLSLRLASDDQALRELQRVVTARGIASGPPRGTGLFGEGYAIDRKTFVVLGRRSLTEPTKFSVMRLP